MQDWSMIPIHIRCTERWKIDPGYPSDGCRFWAITEDVARRMGDDRIGTPYGGVPEMVIRHAMTLKGDTLALQNLAGVCKVRIEDIRSGLKALRKGSKLYPIRRYEEMTQREVDQDEWLKKETV